MRIKIFTNPPLPALRAWFTIPSTSDRDPSSCHDKSRQTVQSLKFLLCSSLPTLCGVAPSCLRLSIDEFELLDNSELTVVRDGDLVCIDVTEKTPNSGILTIPERNMSGPARGMSLNESKPLPGSSQTKTRLVSTPLNSNKRKRHASMSSSSSASGAETSSSSPSSSSSSSSSSESESTSESSTTSASSDSDSDSDASIPRTTPSFPKKKSELTEPTKSQIREQPKLKRSSQQGPQAVRPTANLVPPGYGKPQTRSRNLRRRLKRNHDCEAATLDEPGPVSGANAIIPESTCLQNEEGAHEATTLALPHVTYTASSLLALPSLSLRNKNKAKNFKALIGKPLPPRIIFADLESVASTSAAGPTTTLRCSTPAEPCKPQMPDGTVQQATPSVLPPLIPPSSRSSLPPNLFVTSVDVEAGLHRPKKKRKMRVEYGEAFEGDHGHNTDAGANGKVEDIGGDVTLDYDGGANTDAVGEVTSQGTPLDSDKDVATLESFANKSWATLPKITKEQQVVPGRVVGYKALGINPATYTPEFLLTLVRVLSLSTDPTRKKLFVHPLHPHEELSFSGPLSGYEEEGGGVEAEEEHSWEDIINGDWRLVER
ncbi:hypothetical protein BDN67DRAFT_1014129 [Paxillus ammoniavirescens]|nr:hypothetical protein BDN67DRAFT_1014129 [Paxillus ammoniavirescens]